MTKARDIMTPGIEVARRDETIDSVARRMLEKDVGAMPVCDAHEHINGVITDRDIVVKVVAAGKDAIVHVHISDAKPAPAADIRDNHRVMPGEGQIDLIGFLQALKKIGYVDGISPEPLGRVPAEMPPEEGAKLGLETTLAVMKKAGV